MAIFTSSPRVVGERRPDFYSLETFLKAPQFAGKHGEALALAIYDYFTSTVDGTWHGWPHHENKGLPRVRGRVVDPVKMLNSYGWMICGQCAHMLAGMYRAAGFDYRELGLYGHNVTEVFFEGRWHILDIDMWTWFRTPEGYIASAYELAKSPRELILANRSKSNPCNLPDRDLEGYAGMYEQVKTVEGEQGGELHGVFPRWRTRGHTMDFRLRPGETLVRSQTPQGRFHVPEEWRDMLVNVAHEWPGFPRERYEPFRTYGNGQWIYEPNLSAAYADFEAGVWERDGLTQDARGLVGAGSATFRIQSPYLFAGNPDLKSNPYKYHDGVWIEAAGSGDVRVEIEDAEGQWQAVLHEQTGNPFERRIDVTNLFEARYDGLIRISLGKGARLNRFKFEGFIMTAPMTLPRLAEGDNRMEVRCLDKYHDFTVPWTRIIDFRPNADVPSQWVSAENAAIVPYAKTWQSIAPMEKSSPVIVSYRFDAPAGRQFAWMYVIATAVEAQPDEPMKGAVLEWSTDGKVWLPFAADSIPHSRLQWDASIDGEIRPQTPPATVYVRVTSDTAVSALEFHGHLKDRPDPRDELHIRHRWQEAAGERSFQAPANAANYSVTCGKAPRDHTIEMRVPSRRR